MIDEVQSLMDHCSYAQTAQDRMTAFALSEIQARLTPKLRAYAKRTTEGVKTRGFVPLSLANLPVPNILSVQANSIQTLANAALALVKKVDDVVAVLERIASSMESLVSSSCSRT